MIDLSLVVPCYRDGAHLEESLREIEATLNQTRYSYEFIIIDDASPDDSAAIAERSAARREHARLIVHQNNVGRGGTVTEGIRLAQGRWVGYLDIDLEVHARYIPAMLRALEEGADVAIGTRIYEIRWNLDTLFRSVLSVGYRWLVRWNLGMSYADTETGCKFFGRERILPLLSEVESQGWFWDTEIMYQCCRHQCLVREIPVLFLRRWDKPSTVKPLRDSWDYLMELRRLRHRIRNQSP